MASNITAWLTGLPPGVVYLAVFGLVFAEDALFVGFVLPGETAVIVGGILASKGHVSLGVLIVVAVTAAIVGDSVGYEVGRRAGARVMRSRLLRGRGAALARAEELLRTRGRSAVLLGRFTAFFRATMPALAGAAHMPYRRFLPANAVGGALWGTGNAVLGFVVGAAWIRLAAVLGGAFAAVTTLTVLGSLVAWRLRRRRSTPAEHATTAADERRDVTVDG